MERSSDDSGLSGKKVDLQKILNWSLSLQNLGEDGKTNDAIESVENRSERLDPKILDIIMGKSDFQRMNEALEFVNDSSQSLDDRISVADNLEILMEDLDNAKDFVKAKLVLKLLKLLNDQSDDIRMAIYSMLGTLCQNNEFVQSSFLNDGIFAVILPAMKAEKLDKVYAKAIYFLTSFLKNNETGVFIFNHLKGFDDLMNKVRAKKFNFATQKCIYLFSVLNDKRSVNWMIQNLSMDDFEILSESIELELALNGFLRLVSKLLDGGYHLNPTSCSKLKEIIKSLFASNDAEIIEKEYLVVLEKKLGTLKQ